MQAEPIHYLPIGTTAISFAFVVVLVLRAAPRGWPPHLTWWGIGVLFFGLGTLLESWITLGGNTLTLNRLWYWAGAILGGYPLATGSVYLLAPRRLAHTLTFSSLAFVIFASVCVLISPLNEAALVEHKPSSEVIGWQWVRWLTPFINVYAVIFLVGGAVYSSILFFRSGDQPRRAVGTALIALGGLLPGIGGAMTKQGIVEALYVGEFSGIVLIWIGYEFCIRARAPIAPGPVEQSADEPDPTVS